MILRSVSFGGIRRRFGLIHINNINNNNNPEE